MGQPHHYKKVIRQVFRPAYYCVKFVATTFGGDRIKLPKGPKNQSPKTVRDTRQSPTRHSSCRCRPSQASARRH